MSLQSYSFRLDNLLESAREFVENNPTNKKFAFYGSMGAGKTTFIKAICQVLNAIDLVSSPTFSIINEYETKEGTLIYHFDLYRIKTSEELYDIGFEEYCQDDCWCFVEWPEKAEDLISDEFVRYTIRVNDDETREVLLVEPLKIK